VLAKPAPRARFCTPRRYAAFDPFDEVATVRAPDGELWPLALYTLVVLGLVAAILLIGWALGGRSAGRLRDTASESGSPVPGGVRPRLPVNWYLVALAFLVFDVEVVFLFAWAVAWADLAWSGYAGMAAFVVLLAAGLAWLWRAGALDRLLPASGPDLPRREGM
jgi:NADH-quinone oxidoreductase subunit A